MEIKTATAVAHPNIAFIKYWGNRDSELRLPLNGSISMNLDGLTTRTTLTSDPTLETDTLSLNGISITGPGLTRVIKFMDEFRLRSGTTCFAHIESKNNFPTGAGIASSASAFAALAGACYSAYGIQTEEYAVSRLARLGSGSACRSVPSGFTEWLPGTTDADSYAISIAAQDYWPLVDCIAIVTHGNKKISSTQGHALAATSPLQTARVADADRRLEICRRAIKSRDFEALADIAELDSNLMHAVMMSSKPPIYYWEPSSLFIMKAVTIWRKKGLPVIFTLDAGANVHVITLADYSEKVMEKLRSIPGVNQVLCAGVGGAVHTELVN